MATAKSFTDLAELYTKKVLVTESKQEPTKTDEKVEIVTEGVKSDKVGAKQSIGENKLENKGGDEKVKKDLDKPAELKHDDKGTPKPITEGKAAKAPSLFDTVYNQIVNEEFGDEDKPADDGLDDAPPAPAPDAGGEGGEGAPEGGAEEEQIDPVQVVKELCGLFAKLKKHFGVTDEECIAVEAPLADETVPPVNPVGEATEMKEVPDSAGKKLQGKNNKVAGATDVNGKGKAEAPLTVGDGKPEKAPDAEKKFSGKDNKVKGSGPAVKGGDVSALEG